MGLTPLPPTTLGLARLARAASDPEALGPLTGELVERLSVDAADMGALLDLSTLLQLTGHGERGLAMQADALAQQAVYRRICGEGGLRVLVFMTAGDLMANTPIDFLLEEADLELTLVYVDEVVPDFASLPAHDVAFLAVGESETSGPLLARLAADLRHWPRPVINGRPDRISALTREAVASRFAGHPQVVAPVARRIERADLAAAGEASSETGEFGLSFPLIVRPVGSHAGRGLERLQQASETSDYLMAHPEAAFHLSEFHDYRGADGLFRKFRIVFIQGRPFISHMAVSPRWMVHYLNADMGVSQAHRDEEATLMASFDMDFVPRHADALAAVVDGLALDYFGIDCAETADGKLLLFEADVAMIVHGMDPPDPYAYKREPMRRLFAAFVAMLGAVAASGPPRS